MAKETLIIYLSDSYFIFSLNFFTQLMVVIVIGNLGVIVLFRVEEGERLAPGVVTTRRRNMAEKIVLVLDLRSKLSNAIQMVVLVSEKKNVVVLVLNLGETFSNVKFIQNTTLQIFPLPRQMRSLL